MILIKIVSIHLMEGKFIGFAFDFHALKTAYGSIVHLQLAHLLDVIVDFGHVILLERLFFDKLVTFFRLNVIGIASLRWRNLIGV